MQNHDVVSHKKFSNFATVKGYQMPLGLLNM